MTVNALSPPTFGISGQNLTLSYAGQTSTSPVQNTPNGTSGAAYVNDGQGDSAAISFAINSFGKENFTQAVANPGSDTLTTVQTDPKGAIVTQTQFDVLTGDIITVKIKPDGHGGYNVTRTDDNQNGISAYSSGGNASSGQYANASSLIQHLFA